MKSLLISTLMLLPSATLAQALAVYDTGELEEPISGYIADLDSAMDLTEIDLRGRVLLESPDAVTNTAWMSAYEEAIAAGADRDALTRWWDQASDERWLLAMNPAVAERVFVLAQRLAELAEQESDSSELFRIYRELAELAPHATPSGLSEGFTRAWEEMRAQIADTREIAVHWRGSDACEVRINGVAASVDNGDSVRVGPGENYAQLACESWTSEVYRLLEADTDLRFDRALDDMLVVVDGLPALRPRGDVQPADLRTAAHALGWLAQTREVVMVGLRDASDEVPAAVEITRCEGDEGMTCRTARVPLDSLGETWTTRVADYLEGGETQGPMALWDAGNERWVLVELGEAFEESTWMAESARRQRWVALASASVSFVSLVTATYFARAEAVTSGEIDNCDLYCVYFGEIGELRDQRRQQATTALVAGSSALVFAAVAGTFGVLSHRETSQQRFTAGMDVTPHGSVAAALGWRF